MCRRRHFPRQLDGSSDGVDSGSDKNGSFSLTAQCFHTLTQVMSVDGVAETTEADPCFVILASLPGVGH